MMRPLALITAAALATGLAHAQTTVPPLPEDARAIIEAVDAHPNLEAARASLQAARQDLAEIRRPVAFDATVGASKFNLSATGEDGNITDSVINDAITTIEEGGDDNPEAWNVTFEATATLRPFLYGDLADAGLQAELAVAAAERGVKQTRAALEQAALSAAAGLRVAEEGVTVAEASLRVADANLDATRIRARAGAATQTDVQRAELQLSRAQESVRSARAQVQLTAGSLENLVGPGLTLTDIPSLPSISAPDPAVMTAQDDVARAEIGVAAAQRAWLPTGNLSYTYATDRQNVGVSIESRTLQPSVSYSNPGNTQIPATSIEQALDPNPLDPNTGVDVTENSFSNQIVTIGLAIPLDPGNANAGRAAERRLAAARASLENARRTAAQDALSREEALRAAKQELVFAETDLQLAERDVRDTQRRVDLGLASPLELEQARVTVAQAKLGLLSAQQSLLSASLSNFSELGVPVSEAAQ
jgi:outer membrane protein TolC